MKNQVKLFVVVFMATLLFSLTACGNVKSQGPSEDPDSSAWQTGTQSEKETLKSTTAEEPSSEEESFQDTTTEDEIWKADLEQFLLETYGVIPERYENLGNGIYRVYVEVGGEVMAFGTVNSATGEFSNDIMP